MKCLVAALLATVALALSPVEIAAQELLPINPAEIETIVELLDAVEAAETAVLSSKELSEQDMNDLDALVRVAETIGAADVAARARSLLILARPVEEPVQAQPEVAGAIGPTVDRAFRRSGDDFQTLVTALAATGGTALILSGVFYALAERDYQRWRSTADPVRGGDLYQAWRGYEVLSLATGGAAILSAGTGIPLVYALADAPRAGVTPAARVGYTPGEREARLRALYAERAGIVAAINDKADDRSAWRTVSSIGMVTGLAGTIASISMFYIAEELYQDYLRAPASDEAARLGQQVRFFDLMAIVSGTLGAVGFGTTAGVEIMTRDRSELARELRSVNERIIRVRAAPVDADREEDQ